MSRLDRSNSSYHSAFGIRPRMLLGVLACIMLSFGSGCKPFPPFHKHMDEVLLLFHLLSRTSSTSPTTCQSTGTSSQSFYSFFGSAAAVDEAYGVCATADGGVLIVGSAAANIASLQGKTPVNAYAGAVDFLVIKLDTMGSVGWYTFLGSAAGADNGRSVTELADGTFVIGGHASANIATLQGQTPRNAYTGGTDYLAVKLSATGSVVWYTFLGSAAGADTVSAVDAITGGVVLAGSATADVPTLQGKTPNNAYAGGSDLLAVKLDASGDVTWYTFVGSGAGDFAAFARSATDGGVALSAIAQGDIPTLQGKTPQNAYNASNDMLVVSLSSTGDVAWYTFLGGASVESGQGLARRADGGLTVSGFAAANVATLQGKTPRNAFAGAHDIMVVRLSLSGNTDWYTFLGSVAGTDWGLAVTEASDLGTVVTGYASADIATLQGKTPLNAHAGGDDLVMMKLDTAGDVASYSFLGAAGGGQRGFAITSLSGGGVIVGGFSSVNLPALQGKTPSNPYTGSSDFFIAKIKSDGNL